MTLAASLYAKAASMLMGGGDLKEARALIDEAEQFQFSRADVLDYIAYRQGTDIAANVLTPTLTKIIGKR